MKLNLYSARIVFLFILKQLNTESLDRNMYCARSYSLKMNMDFKPLSGSLCGFLPVVSSLRSAFCCPWEVVKIHESILSCLRSSLQGSVFVIVRRDFSNLERTTATTAKKTHWKVTKLLCATSQKFSRRRIGACQTRFAHTCNTCYQTSWYGRKARQMSGLTHRFCGSEAVATKAKCSLGTVAWISGMDVLVRPA